MSRFDRHQTGGGALVVGYLVVLAGLYRAPDAALDAAMAGPWSALYFIVLPVAGVAAGLYAYSDGPFSSVPLFVFGSYLGFLGLGLILGGLLSSTPVGLPIAVGLVGLVLAAQALLVGLFRFAELVQFGSFGVEGG